MKPDLIESVEADPNAAGINLPGLSEPLVHVERERHWRVEYADFVTAYNATVEQEDLPLKQWKTF
jgi:hypothetical protein